ncbi:MAG: nucleotidyl transferase AbiEii/AbiGii toxin family protein [Candidatus Levybacteria bacterium]|nr:nucleotidyl transferase AbiEii/AbiGii toxin family protein [Candidatus Levybacteria bacterium]
MLNSVLLPETKNLLEKIRPKELPEESYLAGGTAIALQLGHRRSADLDFFTPREFVESQWEEKLKKELGFKLLKRDWQTLIGHIGKVKISLFAYKHKQITPKKLYGNIPIASLQDLAAMKLDTILGRGTKRDLVDIYFLSQKFGLKNLFKFYQKKYGNFEDRELMIKKALVFFDDADKDEMPDMLIEIDWDTIKKWFLEETGNSDF